MLLHRLAGRAGLHNQLVIHLLQEKEHKGLNHMARLADLSVFVMIVALGVNEQRPISCPPHSLKHSIIVGLKMGAY